MNQWEIKSSNVFSLRYLYPLFLLWLRSMTSLRKPSWVFAKKTLSAMHTGTRVWFYCCTVCSCFDSTMTGWLWCPLAASVFPLTVRHVSYLLLRDTILRHLHVQTNTRELHSLFVVKETFKQPFSPSWSGSNDRPWDKANAMKRHTFASFNCMSLLSVFVNKEERLSAR